MSVEVYREGEMICKRTHQLKRRGDYWTIAKTACGKEKLREMTTTAIESVTCRECARDILMIYEIKMQRLNKVLTTPIEG